jgi:hypothetical protein
MTVIARTNELQISNEKLIVSERERQSLLSNVPHDAIRGVGSCWFLGENLEKL